MLYISVIYKVYLNIKDIKHNQFKKVQWYFSIVWVNQKEILDINEHDEISTLELIWCRIWLYTIRIKVNDDDASQ